MKDILNEGLDSIIKQNFQEGCDSSVPFEAALESSEDKEENLEDILEQKVKEVEKILNPSTEDYEELVKAGYSSLVDKQDLIKEA